MKKKLDMQYKGSPQDHQPNRRGFVQYVLINLDFKSNEHASKEEFLKILMKEYEIK